MSLSPLAFARRTWIDGRPITTMYLPGDGEDMRDQPPEVDGDDPEALPDLEWAAARIREFVGQWGDGRIDTANGAHLFARDLEVLARHAQGVRDGE